MFHIKWALFQLYSWQVVDWVLKLEYPGKTSDRFLTFKSGTGIYYLLSHRLFINMLLIWEVHLSLYKCLYGQSTFVLEGNVYKQSCEYWWQVALGWHEEGRWTRLKNITLVTPWTVTPQKTGKYFQDKRKIISSPTIFYMYILWRIPNVMYCIFLHFVQFQTITTVLKYNKLSQQF